MCYSSCQISAPRIAYWCLSISWPRLYILYLVAQCSTVRINLDQLIPIKCHSSRIVLKQHKLDIPRRTGYMMQINHSGHVLKYWTSTTAGIQAFCSISRQVVAPRIQKNTYYDFGRFAFFGTSLFTFVIFCGWTMQNMTEILFPRNFRMQTLENGAITQHGCLEGGAEQSYGTECCHTGGTHQWSLPGPTFARFDCNPKKGQRIQIGRPKVSGSVGNLGFCVKWHNIS